MSNPEVKVVVHTEPHPEDNAMLQALYSRSAMSVTDHIPKVHAAGSGKFMDQYYLGYGHASIADCGFVTVYVEGLSMLAAKGIQDNPLYNGQESSSRYIDWSNQPFYNPYVGTRHEERAQNLLTLFRDFYEKQKPKLVEHLTKTYPKGENEKQTIYDKAILAKSFDILRGFLPCGATTNVAWTTSLRKANEHLQYLALHPLEEIRNVARQLHAMLIAHYPSSIALLPDYEAADDYLKSSVGYYSTGFELSEWKYEVDRRYGVLDVQCENVGDFAFAFPPHYDKRPRKASLPKHDVSLQNEVNYYFKLDFGSYRDLQRHRGGYCSVPAIDNDDGFHPWYYDQLPIESQIQANGLFNAIMGFVAVVMGEVFPLKKGRDGLKDLSDNQVNALEEIKLKNQYLLPMGTLVNLNLRYNIHQSVYVAELRSGQTVHATLRPVAQAMGKHLQENLGLKVYCDNAPDEWTTRRGAQDIVEKVV